MGLKEFALFLRFCENECKCYVIIKKCHTIDFMHITNVNIIVKSILTIKPSSSPTSLPSTTSQTTHSSPEPMWSW